MPTESREPPGFPSVIPIAPTIGDLHRVMVRCTRCDLSLSRTRVVPGAGSLRPRLLIVGEAPGAAEDASGIPFVGRSGALLDEMLRLAGIDRSDVFIANVVRCRPPSNRNPRVGEIRACNGWLREQIRLLDPPVIVPLGRVALNSFLPGARITLVHGSVQAILRDGGEQIVFPLFHPAAVLRDPRRRPGYEASFRDLSDFLKSIGR